MNINTILICDDHLFSRKGLIHYVSDYFNNKYEIIETDNGKKAIDIFDNHHPELVFLDVELPDLNGIYICEHIKSLSPETIVIFVTMHNESTIITAIEKAGANGYILKDDSNIELEKCLNHVLNIQTFYTPIINKFIDESDYKEYERLRYKLNLLTNTEQKVIKLILEGKTSEEIIELLFVTIKSLHNYRGRICKKLELPRKNNSLNYWIFMNKLPLKIFFEQ